MNKYILFLTNNIQGKKCTHKNKQLANCCKIGKEPEEKNLSFIVEYLFVEC